MMKYVLEPDLFALDENCDEKEFKNFVKRIIRWDRWMDEHPDEVYILSSTEQILSDKMCYPVYPVFQKLLEKFEVDYIKACDLNKTISKLLNSTKKIDKVNGKKVTDDAIVSSLELTSDGLGLRDEDNSLKELLWSIYCHKKECNCDTDTYLVFAKNLSDNITMNVEYQTIDDAANDYVDNIDKVQIKCHSSLKDFFRNKQTPMNILKQMTNKEDLTLAIRVSLYQNGALKLWTDAFDNYNFTIQDSFYKDYCDAHYSSNTTIMNRLMEEMSNVLLNNHLSNREDWRIDKGGASGQQCKCGYLAWRWFITRSVKMMYWQKDAHYKFANVKEHDIFECAWEN